MRIQRASLAVAVTATLVLLANAFPLTLSRSSVRLLSPSKQLASSKRRTTFTSSSSSPCRHQRLSGSLFLSTSEPPSVVEEDPELNKKELSKSYQLGQYAFGAAGVVLLLMPDRTFTTLLATKCGGSAGFLMAAGLCYILDGALKHNRLGSDTYKRLNVGLLGFCALGLTAIPGEAAFLPSAGGAMLLSLLFTGLRVFGTMTAYRGWMMGVGNGAKRSIKDMANELVQGAKETLAGLRVQDKKKALTYRNCLLLVCIGIFSSFMEGIFNIRYRDVFNRTLFEISLQWSAVARLFMIATMIYSLKDAAERDRLTGTTFIQLNIMVGIWAVFVGLGQAVYPLGVAAHRGVEMGAFSLPFFLKALKAQKEKEEKKKDQSSSA